MASKYEEPVPERLYTELEQIKIENRRLKLENEISGLEGELSSMLSTSSPYNPQRIHFVYDFHPTPKLIYLI